MNEAQKKHMIKSLDAGIRLDGRKKDEFRKISVEYDVSSTAEGSCKITAGDAEIIAGVKLGLGKPYPDTPDDGVLMVMSELLPLSNPEFESGPPGIDAIETARVIDRGIREGQAMDTKSLCMEKGEKVWMVQVDVLPINFDGNMITLGGFAAIAALLKTKYPVVKEDGTVDYHAASDKQLELQHSPIPITIGKIGKHLLVDLTQEEEKALDARLTIGVMEDGNLCSMQKGGDETLTMDEIKEMVDIAITKAAELRKLL